MHPIIFSFNGITIYSFGLMMGISFIIANYLLTKELQRKKLHPELSGTITLLAVIGGIAGSKILYLLENFSDFLKDPIGMAFSPGGLTFYGGFILATIAIYFYIRKKGIPFLVIADAASPALLLAYGVARIGCHLAGDGDYGFPTTLPWGTDYSKGTYPPSYAFRDFPEITSKFPNGIVPDTTLLHPTPMYEFIICTILFVILWKYRTKIVEKGKMFSWYLIAAGAERFSIEFFRLNPKILFGLSEAQIIAAILIILGIIGVKNRSSNSSSTQ